MSMPLFHEPKGGFITTVSSRSYSSIRSNKKRGSRRRGCTSMYEHVLRAIPNLSVPRCFGVFEGGLESDQGPLLVLEKFGYGLDSFDELSAAQK